MVKRNFTRKDLTDNIFKKIGFSKNFSSKITDNFFDTLVNHIIINNMR